MKKFSTQQSVVALAVAALVAGGLTAQSFAQTSSATAKAKMKVLALLKLTTVKDLVFNEAYQGSASDTVAAGTANAAEFKVEGSGTTVFQVSVPASVTMEKIGGGGTAKEKIEVNNFTTSLPSNSGTLVAGVKNFTVGATRATLLSDQADGDYEGTFQVDVIY